MSATYLSSSNDNSPITNRPLYFLNENSINIRTENQTNNCDNNKKVELKGSIPSLLSMSMGNSNRTVITSRPKGIAVASPTAKQHYQDLPEEIHKMDSVHLESLLQDEVMVFDIRPFNLYSVSRIQNAINLCVPTTLLKRSSFSVKQMLNSNNMSTELKEQVLLKTTDNGSSPMKLLVYDSDSHDTHVSFLLYQTCMKFLQCNDPGNKRFDVFYLNNGFEGINKLANILEKQTSDLASNSITVNHLSNLSGFQLPTCTPSSQKFLSCIKKNNLPKLNTSVCKSPNSNGTHNEDNLFSYDYNFRLPDNLDQKADELPIWLRFFSKEMNSPTYNRDIVSTLNHKFNKIENSEQARLRTAIANNSTDNHLPYICSPSALCPGCDHTDYEIPKGIEYGYKNRYNNIWPYEHSRVKLIKSPNPKKHDEYDDYFNANYISFPNASDFKYIATQNPLQSTYEDFWKTIWSNKINVIVCLNKQLSANLVGQDLKYFESQRFPRSGLEIANKELIQERYFNIRKIDLTKNDVTRCIYHLEYKDWPDFGVPSSFESIIKLIEVKNNLIRSENLNNQILVHCLAGCGRTGCFITLDMILDCFHNPSNKRFNPWGSDDLVYKTVQYQRTQRISMVQNLDQFIFCYEFILNYVVNTFL